MKHNYLSLVASLCILPLFGCASSEDKADAAPCVFQKSSDCGPTKATVLRVIDGDTIVLDTEDQISVRMLLVDTPETVNIDKGDKTCYGQEAKAHTKSLVKTGDTVYLEYDQSCTDKYNRLLAYICVNGTMLNSDLIENGFAYFYPYDNTEWKYRDEFEGLQNKARAGKIGLWGQDECREERSK